MKTQRDHRRPDREIYFLGSLSLQNIRGSWYASAKEGSFIVVWGDKTKCWAYLHQFDPISQYDLVSECRRRVAYQRHDHSKMDWAA